MRYVIIAETKKGSICFMDSLTIDEVVKESIQWTASGIANYRDSINIDSIEIRIDYYN